MTSQTASGVSNATWQVSALAKEWNGSSFYSCLLTPHIFFPPYLKALCYPSSHRSQCSCIMVFIKYCIVVNTVKCPSECFVQKAHGCGCVQVFKALVALGVHHTSHHIVDVIGFFIYFSIWRTATLDLIFGSNSRAALRPLHCGSTLIQVCCLSFHYLFRLF